MELGTRWSMREKFDYMITMVVNDIFTIFEEPSVTVDSTVKI